MRLRVKRRHENQSIGEIVVPDACPRAPSRPSQFDADADSQAAEEAPASPFLSLRESAEWLCVSLSTLKRLVNRGELVTVRVGARQKIPASHLAVYVSKDILLPSVITEDK